MSFQNIGIDNLQASKAFKQIRSSSRTYTNNLTHVPTELTSKYSKLNSLFFNDTKLINSNSFTLRRALNLTSAASSTAVNSTFLDSNSMNKFLTYNLQYNKNQAQTELYNKASDLWTKNHPKGKNSEVINFIAPLIEGNRRFSSPSLKLLSLYPNLVKEMGDDSDKKSVSYPYRRLFKKSFSKSISGRLNNSKSLLNLNSNEYSSSPNSYISTSIGNIPSTSKEFMIQYSYQSQPFSKQSVRRYKNLHPYTTNYNLSLGLNPLDSELSRISQNSNFITPFYKYNSKKTNWSDLVVFNKLSSNRVMYFDIAPLITNNPLMGRLSYDRTYSLGTKSHFNAKSLTSNWENLNSSISPIEDKEAFSNVQSNLKFIENKNSELQEWRRKLSSTANLFAGDRTGEDRSSTGAYWKMYWSGTNPDLRISNLAQSLEFEKNSFLPSFVPYYDYDFRNSQGIHLFEDMVWESIYSGYSHQEYLNIYNKYRETYDPRFYRWSFVSSLFLKLDRGYKSLNRFGSNAKSKDLKSIGLFYSNSIQSDDYFIPVYFLNKGDLAHISFVNDASLMDESYSDQKNLYNFYVGTSSMPLAVSAGRNYPQSHASVLNSFRSDFEDFSFFRDLSLKLPKSCSLEVESPSIW
jgi:hypothetical protein